MTEAVSYRVEGGVAWLTIERPEARNALNAAVREGLYAGVRRFNEDDTAKVLVLTGAGEKAFCAGGDLKEMAETALTVPPPDFVPQFGRNIEVAKPTIAAVNGVAWAGGFLLAQCCDLCIAADTATFAISEVKVGRGAPWAAPLSWLIPPRIALQILLTGDPLTARRAYEIGLVNEVVPLADLRARTQQVASGSRRTPRCPCWPPSAPRTCPGRTCSTRPNGSGRRSTTAPTRRKGPPRSATSGRRCGPAAEPGVAQRPVVATAGSSAAASYRVASSRVEQAGCRSWPRSRVMGRMACCHSRDTFSAMWPSCSSARRISAALFGRSAW